MDFSGRAVSLGLSEKTKVINKTYHGTRVIGSQEEGGCLPQNLNFHVYCSNIAQDEH